MDNKVLEEIKEFSIGKYEENNNVKVHITKLDYPNAHKYDTVGGVWVNGDLVETFEITGICNNEIDEFINETEELVRAKTLFLI